MRTAEEAFETLRSAGLGPDARSAFGAILDCVMNEFDAGHMRWAERAKYRYLVERLAGDQPLILKSQPAGDGSDLQGPESASCYPKREAETAQALETAVIAVGGDVDRGELNSEKDATLVAPAGSISAADVTVLIKKGVGAAIKRAMARPGSEDLLSSRVPAFIEKKREELGPQAEHLADYPGRIVVFLAIVGDKPIGSYTAEDMHRFRDVVDQIPVKAKQRFRTDDPLLQIRLNGEIAIPWPKIDPVTVDAKYLSPIKTLFSHFVSLGIIDRNPLDGIASKRVKGDNGVAIGAAEERLPFEPHHIAAL